ncbi:MAG: tetratricopeptide repeat protein [Rubrivivax sp.]|nr:tetratricopeptide repeat protein [Rubrivivax sp.]
MPIAASPPRLRLFGAPEIVTTAQGSPGGLALPFERRTQVLVHLALRRSWVTRAELAVLLWPEQAYANLRKTLFRLQSQAWGQGVETQGAALRLRAETDVDDFETALREQRLPDALALGQAELLVGFDDGRSEAWTGWLSQERARLRAAWRGAVLQHLRSGLAQDQAVEWSARLLAADPLDEVALRLHMQWLADSGQVPLARRAYRDFADRLRQDLGLTPGAETAALDTRLAAVLPSVDGHVTAIREPAGAVADAHDRRGGGDGIEGLDGFVGRSAEIQQITRRFGQLDCRLLCLLGPGGVGKTRLARRLLVEFGDQYADGAFFVALEDVDSAGDLVARIAQSVALAAGGNDPLEQLVAALAPRELLLVLDNFEQLAAEAGLLARLLAGAPRLRLVVTSRVRLSAAGVWTLPVDGLPCPEPEDDDRIDAFDAVRLFMDAASRAGGTPDPLTDAAAIAEICRSVDGLPLALEMAAAWTRTLPCEAIAADLQRGAELLRAIDPSRPPGHASVEAVFERSFRLLGDAERETLLRLSVFHGSFDVDAARQVVGAALPVLGALVDKSLLHRDGERLSLHPLVQQLAASRWPQGPGREAVARAHAAHYHRRLAAWRPAVEAGDQGALRALEADFDNARAAWCHAVAHRDASALSGSAMTLLHHADHRGSIQRTLELLREALPPRGDGPEQGLHALLVSAIAHLSFRVDRYDEAAAMAAQALAATRGARDHDARLQCHKVLGACALRRGRPADARRHFRQALQLASSYGDARQSAAMLDNLAQAEKASGRFDEALRMGMQSLVEHRRAGSPAGEALCRNNLATLLMDRDDLAGARSHLDEALSLCQRHDLAATRSLVLANLIGVALKGGAFDEAERQARDALAVALAAGQRSLVCWLRLRLSELALQRADLEAARGELAQAMEIALAIGRPALQMAGIPIFARLLRAQGHAVAAGRLLGVALAHPSALAAERALLRKLAQGWGLGAIEVPDGVAAGRGGPPDLPEVLRRIVGEVASAHAALAAALAGGSGPQAA